MKKKWYGFHFYAIKSVVNMETNARNNGTAFRQCNS